ncbi:hypothetical protein Cgig2_024768 [Carnegiea gigantea]|uniref:Uncharacterized protein n=1 Tax=Carnegiea gigantea TaxID=171969 RepID=A0A9Q1GI44_9CARY|nr:hypothetical protein Cgig2_024768 [Carnegiea gigantea]
MLERVVHAATKKELQHMRALLMGRDRGDSLPGGMQNEGLQCTDGDGEGSAHGSDRRVSTSQGDDRYSFHTNFHTTNVGSTKDAHECEPFGDAIQPEGENKMVASPHATEEDVVPVLECNTEQPHANDISPYANPAATPRTGKRRIGNAYTSQKRFTKVTPNTIKEEEMEEIRGGARQADNVATTDMAVVVPVAAASGLVHGPRGIHDTMGHSEEAKGWKTDTGTESTTLADSTPTVAVGDAPIP